MSWITPAALLIALLGAALYAITAPAPLPCPDMCKTAPFYNTPFKVPELGSAPSSPPSEREFDVVIYGATGFTGKLVSAYLATLPYAEVAIAGRNREKLETLKSDLGLDFGIIVSTADDLESLSELAERTRVVMSLAGPYAKYGSRVVEACARTGTNYVDLSGEFFFHRDMMDKFQKTALATGAKIVIAGGYDSVPFDLGSQIVLRDLDVKPGNQVSENALLRLRCHSTDPHCSSLSFLIVDH